ncbi:translation initiation factor IF-2 N-terminal domain-containing protein, partial [Lacrimispora celerecrescens]|uniref:translation initiation factor IF-2 N-terminal domain-containing protein n=1 Tax=Lacrimispora celerecrescens TaxID=29354 RepID=UPI000691E3E7
MRVYDLAKELGKDSSKEILDILEKHNINLKSSSNVTDEQAAIVKKEVGGHSRGTAPAQSSSQDGDDSDAPKKKIAAVFRPQNAQMKPQGQHSQSQSGRPYQSDRQNGEQRNRQVSEQSLSGNAELTREPNTGNRDNREGRPQGGYQGNRDNREGRPQGGYQGNRDNRDGRPQGGYQGNRDGRPQGQGGYQGNRDGRPQGQGGYQGNRDGRPQGQGGYQGNRDGRPQGRGTATRANRDGRPQVR